jgi:tRNA pseudouridine38-40 synthase
VQEVLDKALSLFLRTDIFTQGSGRTDTGVHAKQQIVLIDSPKPLFQKNVLNINGILPKDIVLNAIYEVPDSASARFDAQDRSYEYFINPKPNPFTIETTYFFPRNLDIALMNHVASLMLTHKDFQCFSKVHTEVEHFLCNVTRAQFVVEGDFIVFHVTANRFLRGMVRAIVGTLLEVGLGRITQEQFRTILESKDRCKAGMAVPAHGLYLSKVRYPDGFMHLLD